ncbi:unnamed protein product [Triticum turgidum subsp. durum]|uniref:PTBP1-like RNA recognition motif 2 domain-containing protein n=1 Tax=Triticum turgidum subsp. durum TaxID=4567 RepID=A0A9R1S6Q5_TRITD|nr:unnamed protein product [Triticum turgidum subsp. durum]
MSSHEELFTGGVLHVTVHHVYYPVTEETLQQVFTLYGVVKISVFQRIDHVEAVVQLRSRRGAAQALAMHGRCIYERACLLDIQDVSPEYNLHLCSLLEQKQTATVAEYTVAFWECVHHVLDLNPNLSIKSFVHQYIEGLREDIKDVVRSRSPLSITGASSLARIREDEIVQEAAMAAEKLDDGHGVHVLMPTVILTEVFLELTAPVECSADHNIITIDSNNHAAPTPITCLTECPSHAAAVDISPKLAASALCGETVDIEAISVAAPTFDVCSIVGPTNAEVNSYVPVPLIVWSVNPFSAAPLKVVPTIAHWSCSTPKLDTMASTRCWTLCLDHIGALTPTYMLDKNVNIRQQAQMLRPMPWPSFKCHSEASSPQDPRPATQGIFGKLSTCQPHEDLNGWAASLVLHWNSSFDGHYLQLLAALRSFCCELYYIGGPCGYWQYAYLQQWRSSQRESYSNFGRAGDAILNTKQKSQSLLSSILVELVSRQTPGVGYFCQTSDQKNKRLNYIPEVGEQVMRLCSVELAPWACSALHFIKPYSYGLGMRIIVELKPWPKWKINGRCEGMALFWRSPHMAFPAIFSVTTTNVLHQMDWCYAVQCVQPTNAIGDAALQLCSAKYWDIMMPYVPVTRSCGLHLLGSSVLAFLSVWLYPTCAETVFSFMLQLQALLLITKCSDHGTLSAATATKKQFGINNSSLIQSDVTGADVHRMAQLCDESSISRQHRNCSHIVATSPAY